MDLAAITELVVIPASNPPAFLDELINNNICRRSQPFVPGHVANDVVGDHRNPAAPHALGRTTQFFG